ncbi:MAG: hypothetical protein A3F70_13350 [Acidobacteria bacterium RIFCSPLOWO2_12_FULL_67_14]|nr:MAG: hypothetical protein A3H29_14830 [Acidobacteria bacterium RIFCSPLOWO2_02_FULL_67_21]OFW39197.1 MAG: hypothetical protein A3F70_13350 [Acidobacteria bacterium RIFCSPLOWO2_12_FULL_67_14]
MMEWFQPLWREVKGLLVPFGLAIVIGLYGLTAPHPPFAIAGAWALIVTVAVAVIRSLAQKGSD